MEWSELLDFYMEGTSGANVFPYKIWVDLDGFDKSSTESSTIPGAEQFQGNSAMTSQIAY